MIEHIMYSIMLKTVCKAPKILKLKNKIVNKVKHTSFISLRAA